MSLSERIDNGWSLATISFSILKKEKQLLIFPVLSTISLMLVLGSFAAGILLTFGITKPGSLFSIRINDISESANYMILFIFYLINYFVIIFFNMGLIHCALLYFNGHKPRVKDGLLFSISRLGSIISWVFISATIGLILRVIEDKGHLISSIVSGLIGMLWSVLTFFVVPIMVYENLNMVQAIKRSGKLLKETWGERLGAAFAFGITSLLIFMGLLVPVFLILVGFNMDFKISMVVIGIMVVVISSITTAAEGIFKAAAYQFALGDPTGDFDKEQLNSVFVKTKWSDLE